LENILNKKIEEYNKYRTPEVIARLRSIDTGNFKIEFSGHFCYTCGFYDYFDDFRFLLEELKVKAEITEIEEIDEGAVVTFALES
jgi:superoxide reductase